MLVFPALADVMPVSNGLCMQFPGIAYSLSLCVYYYDLYGFERSSLPYLRPVCWTKYHA